MKFEILHKSKKSNARVGKIYTQHGIINTPNFVPVGTNGTIKCIDSISATNLNVQLMFCNTYHLLLQPGAELIEKAGGLHCFMNRALPIITDSGGFQAFSLIYGGVTSELKKSNRILRTQNVLNITEEGILFRSYRDGSKILLSPESSMKAQKQLGADIIISFDELPPYHIDRSSLKKSLERTNRWEKRSLDYHLNNKKNQAIYAVIHGGIDSELRQQSAKYLTNLPFDGFGIGGSLGKNRLEMINMLTELMPNLPTDKPNHLLGIGDLQSIKECIPLGIDTFDSSYPTRAARHGVFLQKNNTHFNIKKTQFSFAFEKPVLDCKCYTCENYTAAYVHHLFKSNEQIAMNLASIHNIYVMLETMNDYREKIINNII